MTVKAVTGVEGAIKKTYDAMFVREAARCERNLKRVGTFIFGKSQHIVPVELGELKASGFVRSEGSGFGTDVAVGYTAAYALFVHENLDALHGADFNAAYASKISKANRRRRKTGKRSRFFKRGENQQAKFIETPIRLYRRESIQMMKEGL